MINLLIIIEITYNHKIQKKKYKMDSEDIREKLRKQRERWLRERDIDKER